MDHVSNPARHCIYHNGAGAVFWEDIVRDKNGDALTSEGVSRIHPKMLACSSA